MLYFIVLSFINCIKTNGAALYDMLVPNYKNHYWDFFTSIWYTHDKLPYQSGVIYPPGANFLCWILSCFFPTDLYSTDVNTLRDSSLGMIIMLWFILTSMLLLIALILKDYADGDAFEKILFIMTLLLSAPFIREISKLNIIPLSIIFTYIFILYKDSENNYLKLLSLLALACAVAIKIYPVFFGLYLLKKKDRKNTLLCILLGIFVFFLPFAFFDGISGLRLMLTNIFNTTETFTNSGLGFKINIANTVQVFGELLSLNPAVIKSVTSLTNLFMLAAAVISFFFLKENWKALAIVSLITLSFPSFSNSYAVLYMVPALVAFLKEEHNLTFHNLFYVLLFVALFAPMFFGGQNIFPKLQGVTRMNLFTFVESIAIVLMQSALIAEGFHRIGIIFKKQILKREDK